MVGFFDEPVSVVSEGMRLKHLQHFRAGPLDDGDACQKRRLDRERYNWMFGRRWERPLSGDDVIEVRYYDAENSRLFQFLTDA